MAVRPGTQVRALQRNSSQASGAPHPRRPRGAPGSAPQISGLWLQKAKGDNRVPRADVRPTWDAPVLTEGSPDGPALTPRQGQRRSTGHMTSLGPSLQLQGWRSNVAQVLEHSPDSNPIGFFFFF